MIYVYDIKDSDGNVIKTVIAPTMEAIELNTPVDHEAVQLEVVTPPDP